MLTHERTARRRACRATQPKATHKGWLYELFWVLVIASVLSWQSEGPLTTSSGGLATGIPEVFEYFQRLSASFRQSLPVSCSSASPPSCLKGLLRASCGQLCGQTAVLGAYSSESPLLRGARSGHEFRHCLLE